MKNFLIFFLIAGIFSTGAAHAAETSSLFFTPQEIERIEASSATAAPNMPADIHLGAVLYYGPKNWSVWLDNTKWTPDTHRTDVQIIEVKPELVRIALQYEVQPISLKPHQTYRAATGKIVEGLDH